MERKNTKAHDLAFFFSICLLQIIACQVRRTVGIYGCNLIESWHCSSKVLEVHVYSILAAIKYHFQINVSPGLTLMLQLGVVYIYIYCFYQKCANIFQKHNPYNDWPL